MTEKELRERAEQRLAEELGWSDPIFLKGDRLELWDLLLSREMENERLKSVLREVESDIKRATTNNVVWPNTQRMIKEALGE